MIRLSMIGRSKALSCQCSFFSLNVRWCWDCVDFLHKILYKENTTFCIIVWKSNFAPQSSCASWSPHSASFPSSVDAYARDRQLWNSCPGKVACKTLSDCQVILQSITKDPHEFAFQSCFFYSAFCSTKWSNTSKFSIWIRTWEVVCIFVMIQSNCGNRITMIKSCPSLYFPKRRFLTTLIKVSWKISSANSGRNLE